MKRAPDSLRISHSPGNEPTYTKKAKNTLERLLVEADNRGGGESKETKEAIGAERRLSSPPPPKESGAGRDISSTTISGARRPVAYRGVATTPRASPKAKPDKKKKTKATTTTTTVEVDQLRRQFGNVHLESVGAGQPTASTKKEEKSTTKKKEKKKKPLSSKTIHSVIGLRAPFLPPSTPWGSESATVAASPCLLEASDKKNTREHHTSVPITASPVSGSRYPGTVVTNAPIDEEAWKASLDRQDTECPVIHDDWTYCIEGRNRVTLSSREEEGGTPGTSGTLFSLESKDKGIITAGHGDRDREEDKEEKKESCGVSVLAIGPTSYVKKKKKKKSGESIPSKKKSVSKRRVPRRMESKTLEEDQVPDSALVIRRRLRLASLRPVFSPKVWERHGYTLQHIFDELDHATPFELEQFAVAERLHLTKQAVLASRSGLDKFVYGAAQSVITHIKSRIQQFYKEPAVTPEFRDVHVYNGRVHTLPFHMASALRRMVEVGWEMPPPVCSLDARCGARSKTGCTAALSCPTTNGQTVPFPWIAPTGSLLLLLPLAIEEFKYIRMQRVQTEHEYLAIRGRPTLLSMQPQRIALPDGIYCLIDETFYFV